jgi:hypothetical protein
MNHSKNAVDEIFEEDYKGATKYSDDRPSSNLIKQQKISSGSIDE